VSRFPSSSAFLLTTVAICAAIVWGEDFEGAPPTPTEQNEILARIAKYSQDYVDNLPDFICLQLVEQFESRPHSDRWRKGDTLASRLVFNQGQEVHTLEMVNGKPLKPGLRRPHIPLKTEGEFGILLASIISPQSEARFSWAGWIRVDAKRLASFRYWIDKQHSTLKLSLSDLAQAVLPYSGTITTDPDTGEVWRLTSGTSDIPEDVRTRSISTEISYDQVTIGGRDYLLPIRATVITETPTANLRNEMTFRQYRKFTTDSNITFLDDNLDRSKAVKSGDKDRTPQF